jgi:ABC-type Fe3+-hydroxamate transport system substrate-binding protein
MKRLIVLVILCAALPAFAARTVTDELGRSVTVPDHPRRLICLMPSVTDDVYALGAGTDVVAVTDYTKYPAEARLKPSIGLPLSPSMERIVSLHPDLVLGSGDLNRVETLHQLEELGIPVFMVNPHGVAGIYQSIQSLGQALNREQAASELVAHLRQRVEAIQRRVRDKPVVQILMPVWYDPIVTIGSHAYITELIALAGGHSVTSDIPQEWPQVSLEAILVRAPAALLLVQGSKMSLDAVRSRPGWSQIPAVRNNRVYYVSDEIDYPSPVAFNALEELAKELHP